MTATPSTEVQTAPRRVSGTIAADQLRSIVQRIERLLEEKAGLSSDIADIYAESKSNGYDVKTLRKVIPSASSMPPSAMRRSTCSTHIWSVLA